MSITRGKRRIVCLNVIENTILSRKNDIVTNGVIAPATSEVWAEIALSLDFKLKSHTLYSYAVASRYNIREKLLGKPGKSREEKTTNSPSISSSFEDLSNSE